MTNTLSTLPDTIAGQIEFYEQRNDPWQDNATEIGLSEQQALAMTQATLVARTAYENAQQARLDSIAATEAQDVAVAAMLAMGGGLQSLIRSTAKATDDPTVYQKALLPAPGDRQPTPAPGTPYQFKVALEGGDVVVRFKCDNPGNVAGVTYLVERRYAPQTPFEFLAVATGRTFTDGSIPQGTGWINYRITAMRTTGSGVPAQAIVEFGGANQVSITERIQKPAKKGAKNETAKRAGSEDAA